ncbi:MULTISPECIES: TFIIB-type zinc ribbon-containing protein [unclassified Leptolyngbya]|uniref:TFIIB-type zinc ribbon-containing protein n=1 Tax=unclassified Leptolyngbya TaxID=2650499 RepID=UPI001685AFCA|nr:MULTISPECIES: TFIIB-type zinc ribbon-containing protein [unclassified Leptolyngbya]MBD1911395.1 TFIIB-type zinc ribbon-containing protein [Leptolyngbya sp. FACHB-8]MBD2155179.1 TFIIB-type zinc ribbon-containing protein [Leptolyngbya sp. FACHB-16]
MTRFLDTGKSLDAFQDEVLVRCPNCQGCAMIRLVTPNDTSGWFAPRRLTCSACGTAQDWTDTMVQFKASEPTDAFFRYPLWLQTPCCNQILWANNQEHLDFLENFVRATLRERQPDDRYGWFNQSLASRLPKWMQSRKHRDEVLRAIAKLRTKLPS